MCLYVVVVVCLCVCVCLCVFVCVCCVFVLLCMFVHVFVYCVVCLCGFARPFTFVVFLSSVYVVIRLRCLVIRLCVSDLCQIFGSNFAL